MAPVSTVSEDGVARRRVSKKLQKKRREDHHPTMELPDRLKDHGDDIDEDVLPPSQGPQMFMNMNQSIFGLIAAAGSNVDFNDRFEGQSSDEDDGDLGSKPRRPKEMETIAQTTVLNKTTSDREKGEKHRRRLSGQLLRSLPQLPRITSAARSKFKQSKSSGLRPSDSSVDADGEGEGENLSLPTDNSRMPPLEVTKTDREGRLAPVMSRMLEARAEMSSRPSFDLERLSGDHRRGDGDEAQPSRLARQLKRIFEFDEPEEVIDGIF